jgi:hypothetical protein
METDAHPHPQQQQQEQQQQQQEQQQQQQRNVSARALVDVACPLLTQFILEGGGGDTERAHDKKQLDVDRWGLA